MLIRYIPPQLMMNFNEIRSNERGSLCLCSFAVLLTVRGDITRTVIACNSFGHANDFKLSSNGDVDRADRIEKWLACAAAPVCWTTMDCLKAGIRSLHSLCGMREMSQSSCRLFWGLPQGDTTSSHERIVCGAISVGRPWTNFIHVHLELWFFVKSPHSLFENKSKISFNSKDRSPQSQHVSFRSRSVNHYGNPLFIRVDRIVTFITRVP